MGAYVTLEIAKSHLSVEPDFTDDDIYIENLVKVAEVRVAKELCVSPEELATLDGGVEPPAPVIQAILLIVGTYYANRESITAVRMKEIPGGVSHLLQLYRNYSL